MSITSANRQDTTDARETIPSVGKGDLVIRDLGYFTLGCMQQIMKESYAITRLHAQTKVFESRQDACEELDLGKIHEQMTRGSLEYMEKTVHMGAKSLLPVRLIMVLMPDEVYQKRMREVNKGNKKRGYRTSKAYATRARFNLFVTNITADMLPGRAVTELYRTRWQVELVFKIWKSTFGIDNTRSMKFERWLCLLYVKLIFVTINWQLFMSCRTLLYNKRGRMLSMDKCFKTFKDKIHALRLAIRSGDMHRFLEGIEGLISVKHWVEKKGEITGIDEKYNIIFCKSDIYEYI